MNYKNLVNQIKSQTGKEYQECVNVVDAYEKYCTEEIKRPFKKEVDDEMVTWISSATTYDKQNVSEILEVLVTLVRSEAKRKIPFMK